METNKPKFIKPDRRVPISIILPEGVHTAVTALREKQGLSLARWMATDPRVVQYSVEHNLPEPVFSPAGRPRRNPKAWQDKYTKKPEDKI